MGRKKKKNKSPKPTRLDEPTTAIPPVALNDTPREELPDNLNSAEPDEEKRLVNDLKVKLKNEDEVNFLRHEASLAATTSTEASATHPISSLFEPDRADTVAACREEEENQVITASNAAHTMTPPAPRTPDESDAALATAAAYARELVAEETARAEEERDAARLEAARVAAAERERERLRLEEAYRALH